MNKTSKIFMASLLAAGLVGCAKPAPAETPAVEETTQTTPEETKEAVGAWAKAENTEITPEMVEKFEKAFGKDSGFKPVKLLATQVVSGTNYLFECLDANGEKKIMGFNEAADGALTVLAEELIPAEFLVDEKPAEKADEKAAEAPAEEKKEEEQPAENAETEKAETEEASDNN